MKNRAARPRNLVHRAMLQSRRGGAHGKSHKQQRCSSKVAFKRSLKEGGFVEPGAPV